MSVRGGVAAGADKHGGDDRAGKGPARCGPRSLGIALKWGEGSGVGGEGRAGERGAEGPLTVGLITVGNEVLSAKVADANTGHACAHLQGLGIVVEEALILPDREARIAEAVRGGGGGGGGGGESLIETS